MSRLHIVPAHRGHAKSLLESGTIRKDDVAEWVLGSQGIRLPTLLEKLWSYPEENPGVAMVRRAAVRSGGEVLCLWGVTVPPHAGIGYVWLIASTEAEKHAVELTLRGREELAGMHEIAGGDLHAYVWERNAMHIRWLQLLGFERPSDGKVSITDGLPPMWHLYVHKESA